MYQQRVESKDQVLVGQNKFQTEGKLDYSILKVSEEVERAGIEGVRAVRSKRSDAAVKDALSQVSARANDGTNLMPAVIDAVKARCTLGEISDTLREVFGVYQEQ